MSLSYPVAPSGRLIRLLDLVLVVWVAGWIALGALVAAHVQGLTSLSDTVGAAGRGLEEAGRQLRSVGDLPFVGDRLARVGEELDRGARSALGSARESRRDLETLSVLLGVAVAAAPAVPLVALYAPLRWARIKEVRAVRRGLRRAAGDPMFEEFLARRAAQNLPYRVLRRVTDQPWRDIEEGRHRELARAELRRLGIRARYLASTPSATADRRLPFGSAG